jgi:hypothetical protein
MQYQVSAHNSLFLAHRMAVVQDSVKISGEVASANEATAYV